jgi:hypothetical protein
LALEKLLPTEAQGLLLAFDQGQVKYQKSIEKEKHALGFFQL